MTNIFETLKAQQDTAKALQEANKAYTKEYFRREEERLAPVRKSFQELTPTVEKVLLDLGAILPINSKDYLFIPNYSVQKQFNQEERVDGFRWLLSLNWIDYEGKFKGDNRRMVEHHNTHYSVKLVYSDYIPSHLECAKYYVRPYKNETENCEPSTCGFSEDELANTLHQLYSRPMVLNWNRKR